MLVVSVKGTVGACMRVRVRACVYMCKFVVAFSASVIIGLKSDDSNEHWKADWQMKMITQLE